MYSTKEMLSYISGRAKVGEHFVNSEDKNIHVFRCIDGVIRQGEIGNGAIKPFERRKYENSTWILEDTSVN